MGDGYCSKHKMVYPFYKIFENMKEICPYCAKEKNICQACGKILKNKEKYG